MNTFTLILVYGFTLISLVLIALKVRILKALAGFLIVSQLLCLYDIVIKQPAQVAWMCNIAVFMNIFLIFKFKQLLFDIFFYFTWLGCFVICMMPINEYSLSIIDKPIFWVAYWIKHLCPLLFTLYFLYVEKRKLSWHAVNRGVIAFFTYAFIIYYYNILFKQNVLYINEPAPFMKPLGKHYFWIITPFGYVWLGMLYSIAIICKRAKSKNEYLPKDRIEELKAEEN